MAPMADLSRWFAQITTLTWRARKSSVGVRQYLVGTSTTGARRFHSARNAKISAGLDWREWIRIASAPAA